MSAGARSIDVSLDLLVAEAAALTTALKRVDEELWAEAARHHAATAARNAARLLTAALTTATQTPYVAAMDAAVAKSGVSGRGAR